MVALMMNTQVGLGVLSILSAFDTVSLVPGVICVNAGLLLIDIITRLDICCWIRNAENIHCLECGPIILEMRNPRNCTQALLICQPGVTSIYVAISCVVNYYCGSHVASPALGSTQRP
jgi:hypothetical protein